MNDLDPTLSTSLGNSGQFKNFRLSDAGSDNSPAPRKRTLQKQAAQNFSKISQPNFSTNSTIPKTPLWSPPSSNPNYLEMNDTNKQLLEDFMFKLLKEDNYKNVCEVKE